jgi:hypothetical protein
MSDLPESYTADTFREFLLDELEATGTVLGWTDKDHKAYKNAQRRTLRVLGETEIAVSDAASLETVGTVEIWRGVLSEVTTDHNFSADGASYSKDQIYTHADLQFKRAIKVAIGAGFYPLGAMSGQSSAMETRQRW